jgi:hypothetical protein
MLNLAKAGQIGSLLSHPERVRLHLEAMEVDPKEWYRGKLAERAELAANTPSNPFGINHDEAILERERSSHVLRSLAEEAPAVASLGIRPGQQVASGPWTEGINFRPGRDGTSGSIDTDGLYYGPSWNGRLEAEGGDPGDEFWWVHNWRLIIPFPPPALPSVLAYRFTQAVRIATFEQLTFGTFAHFLSVGEIPRLTDHLTVTGGSEYWPLFLNLPYDAPHFRVRTAEVHVSGTMRVAPNRIPALALIAGITAGVGTGYLELLAGSSVPARAVTVDNQWIDFPDYGLIEYRYISDAVFA